MSEENPKGLVQHVNDLADLLLETAGKSEITLKAAPGLGYNANAELAYVLIWSLKQAGVKITNLDAPEGYRYATYVKDRYKMQNSFKTKNEFTLSLAAPITEEQIATTRQHLKEFNRYASTGWKIEDEPEKLRQNLLEDRIKETETSNKDAAIWGHKPTPTIADIPAKPYAIAKPIGKGKEYEMHEVLFYYLLEVAKQLLPDRSMQEREYSLSASNNSIGIINYDDRHEPIERAGKMIGVPSRLLTRDPIGVTA